MKNKYIRSGYYKFLICILSLTIIIAMFGCGSGSAQYEEPASSIEYSGSVALSWNAPTQNEDGSPLTDLAGYIIYYGTSSNNYTHQLDVGNVTGINLSNLAPDKYYFRLAAYDHSGNESGPSTEIWRSVENS